MAPNILLLLLALHLFLMEINVQVGISITSKASRRRDLWRKCYQQIFVSTIRGRGHEVLRAKWIHVNLVSPNNNQFVM